MCAETSESEILEVCKKIHGPPIVSSELKNFFHCRVRCANIVSPSGSTFSVGSKATDRSVKKQSLDTNLSVFLLSNGINVLSLCVCVCVRESIEKVSVVASVCVLLCRGWWVFSRKSFCLSQSVI